MTILVTGATGNVGSQVLRTLTARGEPVRAYTRGDSLDGVDRLFLACGNVPEQVRFECAMIDAAAAAGVTRVVKLSGPAADVESPLLFERWHGVIEQHLADSGLPAVRLRPATFMTNLLMYAPAAAATGLLFAPAADAAVAFVDPRDVADAAVVALTTPGHDGAAYRLTGPAALTYAEVAAALGVTYQHVDDDSAREALLAGGVPPMFADAVVAIFAAQRAGAMSGVTDTLERLTGRPPRTVAAFAREHAAAFRRVGSPAR
jgi:uncharacterized protein YbjT (DUF2867 family)